MNELAPSALPDSVKLRFRTTQRTIDYLTGLALVDNTTLDQEAQVAVDDFLESPASIDEPIERRKLIRKVEMEMPIETLNRLGALATAPSMTVDQVLHTAFDRYTQARIDSPELQQTLRGMIEPGA